MPKVVILNNDDVIGQASKTSRANNMLSKLIASSGIEKKSETNYPDGTKSMKTNSGNFETLKLEVVGTMSDAEYRAAFNAKLKDL